MPNWCSNSLVISGDVLEILKIKAILGSVEISKRPGLINSPNIIKAINNNEEMQRSPKLHFSSTISSTEAKDDWYDFRVNNWGTKWEPSDVYVSEESPNNLYYTYETAWADPRAWLDDLSARFPNISMQCTYREEGMAAFGYYLYDDGRVYCEDHPSTSDLDADQYRISDSEDPDEDSYVDADAFFNDFVDNPASETWGVLMKTKEFATKIPKKTQEIIGACRKANIGVVDFFMLANRQLSNKMVEEMVQQLPMTTEFTNNILVGGGLTSKNQAGILELLNNQKYFTKKQTLVNKTDLFEASLINGVASLTAIMITNEKYKDQYIKNLEVNIMLAANDIEGASALIPLFSKQDICSELQIIIDNYINNMNNNNNPFTLNSEAVINGMVDLVLYNFKTNKNYDLIAGDQVKKIIEMAKKLSEDKKVEVIGLPSLLSLYEKAILTNIAVETNPSKKAKM